MNTISKIESEDISASLAQCPDCTKAGNTFGPFTSLSPFEESLNFNINTTEFKAFEPMQTGEKMMGIKGRKIKFNSIANFPFLMLLCCRECDS